MDYQYDVVNYDKNIPATIMYLNLSSETRKTELQWHREPELVYVIEGTSECIRNGESKMVEEGDFILINSEDVHLVRPVSGTGCRLLCVNFSFEYIRMFCKSIDSVFFDVNGDSEVHRQIADILKEIAATGSDGDYVSLLQISHINRIYYLLLSQCMCFRRSGGTVSATKRDFSYAKTAIAYINENYKREIPLNEISSVVNLSPSYFSKYFKNVTQVSFSKYLANLRLENAINDMIHHNS
ncbi:MAG: AraC family transcriptional regulator, partial [Ruminococcus sp.]|nr:AraC family transcriptional regulator [Ruminococcus sp.]